MYVVGVVKKTGVMLHVGVSCVCVGVRIPVTYTYHNDLVICTYSCTCTDSTRTVGHRSNTV